MRKFYLTFDGCRYQQPYSEGELKKFIQSKIGTQITDYSIGGKRNVKVGDFKIEEVIPRSFNLNVEIV